jgi:hypothetical protein
MPERERAQKRAQRRRCHHPVTEYRRGLPGPQQIAVIDAVRTQRHRRDERHHLAARVRGAGPITETDRLINQRLDPEPISQHRRQHQTGVGDDALIVKHDARGVRQTLHHVGDLLVQARRRRNRQLSACSGGHLKPRSGRPHPCSTVDRG